MGRGSRVGVAAQSQGVAEHRPEREVRRRRVVVAARAAEDGGRRRGSQQLRDQTALADTGLPDDLDEAARAGRGAGEGLPQHVQLGLPPHERRGRATVLLRAQHRTDARRADRLALALDEERLERVGGEAGRRALERRGRGEHLPVGGLAHDARRQVHRVALDRVGPPERGAEVAGEHVAAVHADPQGQHPGAVHDGADGAQHALLVASAAARRARDEHDLAAVAVDVGLEEGHVVLGGRPLDVADALVERLGDGGRPGGAGEVVRAPEAHEGDGDRAVLGLALLGQHLRPHRAREELLQRGLVDRRRQRGDGPGAGGGRPQPQQPAAVLGPRPVGGRREQGGGAVADRHLPGVGERLHAGGAAGCRSDDEQLAVVLGVADEVEVELVAVDADRHPERHGAARRPERADRPQRGPHVVGGGAGAGRVAGAGEQQQDGVATPLHEVGALAPGVGEQGREGGVEQVAHLLGPDVALAGQPFGEPREAGDVDERQRAVDLHVAVVAVRRLPGAQQVGDVRRDART